MRMGRTKPEMFNRIAEEQTWVLEAEVVKLKLEAVGFVSAEILSISLSANHHLLIRVIFINQHPRGARPFKC
jgi:hypothetical protein